MLLHPAVLVLLACSVTAALLTTAATGAGVVIAIGWDPSDSGSGQLARERRRLLVEALLKLVFCWQLVSVFLFVATADRLHQVLAGAMCAAGTLNANPFGYPALGLKLLGFIFGGLWLILNRVSDAVYERVMVVIEFAFLILLWIELMAENFVQYRFFAGLRPNVLTSCCGVVFDSRSGTAMADLASIPIPLSKGLFIGFLLATLGAGLLAVLRRGALTGFAVLSGLLGLACAVAVVSWVAPGFYRLPTHHCPFCLLSASVGCVGYPLFAAWGAAVIAGLGSGLVHCARSFDHHHALRDGEERRLCVVSMASYLVFAAIALWPTIFATARIGGS